ncbi:MAG: 3-deoxy-7-phosphoheptulonate synthase [Bacteroidaceae bacterium]|nr:3-deoxy-7-phosphoheptulonate synthase [Bacteroidaceae bacterium]
MIAVLKKDVSESQKQNLVKWLKGHGVEVHISEGQYQTVVGLVGDTSRIDIHLLEGLDMVESVTRISEPFKCANRRFHPADTIVEVGSGENKVLIGGGNTAIIAGPCSVESEEQIVGIARSVKASGASLLRGGAFKPRTSPYDFQGLREDGLELLRIARKETGLPIVTEIMSEKHLDFFEDVDLIQIGARNMQNFELLKALGKVNKPILLKRGLSATVKEWLMSAEYIMAGGNEKIILCERGIRSYDTYTRNVLDLSVIPVLRELTHLPVIVDPSHATGHSRLVPSMSLAAMAAGADGLIIEVHNDPAHALCDGAQSLTPAQFDELAQKIRNLQSVIG